MKTFCLTLSLVLLISKISASTVIISQPTFTGLADYAPTGFGQSFTIQDNYGISAFDLYISASFGGSDATLSVYNYDSDLEEIGPIALATGRFLETELSSNASWLRIDLNSTFSATAGNEYAFIIVADDPGGSATGWNNYGVNTSDVYLGGSRISDTGSASSADLAFNVIGVTDGAPGVPEPATYPTIFGMVRFIYCATKRRYRPS